MPPKKQVVEKPLLGRPGNNLKMGMYVFKRHFRCLFSETAKVAYSNFFLSPLYIVLDYQMLENPVFSTH